MGNNLNYKQLGVQRRMISVVNCFVFLRLLFFYFVVAICDLVHAAEAMYGLPSVLTASGNLFWNMSDARETANFKLPRQEQIIEITWTLTV